MSTRAAMIPLLLSLSACAAETTPFTFSRDAGGGGDVVRAGDVGGGALPDVVTPIPIRDSGLNTNCSEAAQLVYVLSDDNVLYSFRPNLRQFTRIGALRCPTDMQPNSMAIDRDAVAWVNYVRSGLGDTAGAIYRVNTRDASCTDAPPLRLPNGWFRLGMGFSTASADSTDEALFVASTADPFLGTSLGLGRVDVNAGTVVPIGPFTGALRGQSGELTGTGDGRLFGFFTTTPVRVTEIDKSSGAILNSAPLTQVPTPSAWAFSFWGGDFYLYTAPTGRTSSVSRYRPSDGSVDTAYMTDVGFRIVGAGVSTCAPIAPPP